MILRCGLRPVASASPGSLLDLPILGSHSRPKTEALRSINACFIKPSGRCTLESENHRAREWEGSPTGGGGWAWCKELSHLQPPWGLTLPVQLGPGAGVRLGDRYCDAGGAERPNESKARARVLDFLLHLGFNYITPSLDGN